MGGGGYAVGDVCGSPGAVESIPDSVQDYELQSWLGLDGEPTYTFARTRMIRRSSRQAFMKQRAVSSR